MCEPTSVMMIAGAALSAVSQIQQRQAASETKKFNAAVAENNALAARQQAAFQEARQREQSDRALATQRVRFGKGGLTAQGTVLDVNADRAASGELEALTIRRAGLLQDQSYQNKVALDRFNDDVAESKTALGAGSALLTAADDVDWKKLTKPKTSPYSTNPAHYASTGGFLDSQ